MASGPRPDGRTGWPAAVLVVVAAAVAGGVGSHQPLLVAGGAVLVALGVAALRWPDLPTLAVILLVYTNAVGIAVTQHGLPKLIGVLFPAAMLVPLAHHLVVRRQRLVAGPVAGWMLLFLGFQVAGTFLSANRSYSSEAVITYLTEGVFFYLLVVNVIRSYQVLRLAVWSLLAAGAFLGALGLHQQVTASFDNNYGGFAQVSDAAFETGPETLHGTDEQPRLAGAIGQQNYHAQLMLMLVPLGFLLAWHQRSRLGVVVAGGLTVFTVVGMGLTFSRGAMVGAVLMLVTAVFLGYLKLRQFLLMGLGAVLLLQLFPQYGIRLTSVTELASLVTASEGEPGLEAADGSTQSRTTEMAAAGMVFLDYPVIGVGPAMFRFYYDDYTEGVGLRYKDTQRVAHNLYLELAANTGILGLGAFLGAVAVTLVALARLRRRCLGRRPELAGLATGFFLAIVSYLATGLFLSPAFVRYFWLIMALAGAACRLDAAPSLPQTVRSIRDPERA